MRRDRDGGRFYLWRVDAVRWDLERVGSSWQVRCRTNRLLDDSGHGAALFADVARPRAWDRAVMAESEGRLAGKVAVITGASTGLGPDMAALFVREGAQVLLAARSRGARPAGGRSRRATAIAMRADVTEEADVVAMIERAVDAFGHVDIMCNNTAAPGQDVDIWEQTLENWNATIAIDVTAAMLCTREVLAQSMLERRSGVILNFSSTAAFSGMPARRTTSPPRPPSRAFTKSVANEVGPYGIRCNCLVPGSIDTELWRNWVRRSADERGVDYETQRAQALRGTSPTATSPPPTTSPTSPCSWRATRAAPSPGSRSWSTPADTCSAEPRPGGTDMTDEADATFDAGIEVTALRPDPNIGEPAGATVPDARPRHALQRRPRGAGTQ